MRFHMTFNRSYLHHLVLLPPPEGDDAGGSGGQDEDAEGSIRGGGRAWLLGKAKHHGALPVQTLSSNPRSQP